MSDRVFVDTNVLIYAHAMGAGRKREVAVAKLDELWAMHLGVLSTQVLQEFYVGVTRKIPSPLSPAAARDVVRTYAAWPVEVLRPEMILRASEIAERHTLHFWDGLIIAAAIQSQAGMILSEDLNAGQTIEGVRIENPFTS